MASTAWSRLPLILVALCLPATAYALPTYKEPPVSAYPESTSTVQRIYDEIKQRASTVAGAPNAPSRGTDAPRLRVAPNAIDSTTQKVLSELDDVGGARQAYKTEQKGLPRRTYKTVNEILAEKRTSSAPQIIDDAQKEIPAAPQIIDGAQKEISGAPQIIEGKALQPIQLKTPPQIPTLPTILRTARPLIKGSAIPSAPAQIPVIRSAPQTHRSGFMFRSIDQGETLTTPMLGGSSSK